jgi:hypothetical protein
MASNLEVLDKKMKKIIEVQLRDIKKYDAFKTFISKEVQNLKEFDYVGL